MRSSTVIKPTAARGAVVVESAIVTMAILGLVLGSLQLGLLGFLQITVDAGAFLNAHQNAIGVNDALGPADATHQVFPQIPAGTISESVQAAPALDVPVDYLYNGTQAEQTGVFNNRHGGASMMQPYLAQSKISFTPLHFLGQAFDVQSEAAEPNWLETNPEWDVTNTGYASGYTGNSAQNANYFSEGENAPPYYVSFNYIQHCASSAAWGSPTSGARGVCPGQNQDFLALGVAEHLDIYDWANPAPGVEGTQAGSPGTFQEMACHQRYFAQVADFLASAQAQAPGGDTLNYLERTYNPFYYNNTYQTGNFSTGNFFSKLANGANSSGDAATANIAINTIYSWDVERQSAPSKLGNNPGDNPLHPTTGC